MRALIGFLLLLLCLGCAEKESTTATGGATAPPATETTATAPPPSPVASRDVCAMVSAEELKAATTIEGAGQKSTSGGADVCTWYGGPGAAIVQVYPSVSSYEQSRGAFEGLYKVKAEDLSGVGEKAFYMDSPTGSMPTTTISAVKGSNAISVQIMGAGMDAAARKKAASDLANVVLSKL